MKLVNPRRIDPRLPIQRPSVWSVRGGDFERVWRQLRSYVLAPRRYRKSRTTLRVVLRRSEEGKACDS